MTSPTSSIQRDSPKEENAGTKRKADAASPDHRATKKQITIEDSINGQHSNDVSHTSKPQSNDEENADQSSKDRPNGSTETGDEIPKPEDDTVDVDSKQDHGGDTIQESSQREDILPSNILEKGLVYFFTRNRVSVDEAESVGDLQRTFFVLRPLPLGAKLGDGALPDLKNNRLLALPKKVFPKSQ